MKIVQIVTQMEAGGAQRVAILLNEALRNRGYDAEVWFLYLKRPAYADFPGVRIILEHKPSGLDYWKILIKFQQFLQFHKPDILITHTHYANVICQFIARFYGISRRIAVQHNPVHTYPTIAKWADCILGTTSFYSANIGVSQVVVDSVIKHPFQYRKDFQKIYNGIPYLTSQNSDKQVRRLHWGLPENAPLLINVGRLARQKNQATLIEALLHLPEAHLILIGEGELRTTLEKKVTTLKLEKKVHFLGELKSQDVLDLLSISDVFVFPSLYEAMPMALVEAMGLGIPIVASDIPAMREVLADAGIIIPAENAEEIAKGVRQILNSPELANHLHKSALKRASLFSVDKMVESYEKLFN
jgi:glycosyltransferase involved in cell wall biosynthesis